MLTADHIVSVMTGYRWVWPICEILHFIGLAMLFGAVGTLGLRILGFVKGLPMAAMRELLVLGISGFGINLITGMLFFIATPQQYAENVGFHLKMILMLLAGVTFVYLTVSEKAWTLGPGEDASLTAKVIAACSFVLWLGVAYFGRLLPYYGNAF